MLEELEIAAPNFNAWSCRIVDKRKWFSVIGGVREDRDADFVSGEKPQRCWISGLIAFQLIAWCKYFEVVLFRESEEFNKGV